MVDRFESTQVPVFTTQEKIVRVPEFQEKIFERIVIMPQVVEVLKYVTEICETDNLVAGLSVDVIEQESRYKELYGVTKKQTEILITELRKLRGTQPHLVGIVELLERYLVDFDRLSAVQRIVPVDREKIVEKEVVKSVLVPTKDSESIRTELSHSLLIEKLVLELKRIQKENSNVKINLDNDIGLVLFSEFYDKSNLKSGGNFNEQLTQYTTSSLAKLNSLGGEWATDHELMINTILQERFTMGATVQQANIEIERAKAISEHNSLSVKDLENKWIPMQKLLKDKQVALNNLLNNNPSLKTYPDLVTLAKDLEGIVTGSKLSFEPLQVISSEFQVGTGTNWNRAMSRMRELELGYAAIAMQMETGATSSSAPIDTTSQATINHMRAENDRLARELDNLKKNSSIANSSSQQAVEFENKVRISTAKIQELELQLKTANSRVADFESQIRTAHLRIQELEQQVKAGKEVRSSAATETNQLIDSKYSSSSTVNPLTSGIAKSSYEPSYQTNTQETRGLTGSEIQSGSTYTTGGTAAYQSSAASSSTFKQYAGLNNSGQAVDRPSAAYGSGISSTSSNVTPYGATGSSTAAYGASGSSTSGLLAGYGATTASISGLGASTTSTTGPSYAASSSTTKDYRTTTNVTTTGVTGTTTSGITGATSFGANLAGSGARSSGSNLSGYTFQTKKI